MESSEAQRHGLPTTSPSVYQVDVASTELPGWQDKILPGAPALIKPQNQYFSLVLLAESLSFCRQDLTLRHPHLGLQASRLDGVG